MTILFRLIFYESEIHSIFLVPIKELLKFLFFDLRGIDAMVDKGLVVETEATTSGAGAVAFLSQQCLRG